MAYEDTTYLKRKAENLREPRYGIIQLLRDRKAGKVESQLAEAEKRNQMNQQQELAAILKGRETGRVGDSYASRSIDQYVPSDPELRKLMAQQLLGRTTDPSDLERYMAMTPEDRAAALEFRRNPYLDQGNQYVNANDPTDVIPRNLRPGEEPVVRGQQAAAVEAAETAAIPGQVIARGMAERELARPQAQERLDTQERQTTLVDGFIDDAMNNAGFWTTGLMGSVLSGVGGTPAHDLASTIDTIEANIGFDKLNQMRQQSPTGGALGSVTERELSLLSSTLGSLKQSQSPEQLKQNLEIIREQIRQIVHGSQEQFDATYGAGGGASVTDQADEILRRAGIIQ